ncbi:MAG TPA: glycosyltransferase [Patescibacteria group bacterium]|nr:glycosyltransferase [Patescibacteria group bacterium]
MTFYLANYKSLDNEYLNSLFSDLESKNYHFISGPCLYKKKIKRSNKYLFFLLLPFLIFKAKKEIKKLLKKDSITIICATWPERIIFSSLLKLYGKKSRKKYKGKQKEEGEGNEELKNNILKVQWWFLPEAEIRSTGYNKKIKKLLEKYSKDIKIIAFHKREQEKLKESYDKKVIHFPLLTSSKRKSHQESIFDNLSKSKSLNFFHRYFSIVVLADLKSKNYTEAIIKGLPELLKAIPSAQLLIIGLNKDHESLKWLAKKLGVEKSVWFLNEKDHINEWLNTANLFILSNKTLSLSKYYYLLLALNKSLPIITLKEQNISYLLQEKECSLESKTEVDDLISAIISLYRDPIKRKELESNSYYLSTNTFNLDKEFKRLQDILK